MVQVTVVIIIKVTIALANNKYKETGWNKKHLPHTVVVDDENDSK
jgi:hypothetical protein